MQWYSSFGFQQAAPLPPLPPRAPPAPHISAQSKDSEDDIWGGKKCDRVTIDGKSALDVASKNKTSVFQVETKKTFAPIV